MKFSAYTDWKRGLNSYSFKLSTGHLLTINVDAKESDVTLGDKWYPTQNGLAIKDLKINWKQN